MSFDLGREVWVVPNGVSLPAENPRIDVRRRWSLPLNAPLIVYLGRLHPTKRIDLLLDAFSRVRRAESEPVLVLAGREDGISWDALSGGASRAVHWLGEIGEEEKWALLSEASCLVMCSDSESFGLSVVEALAAAVPVVVTHTCPWEEVNVRGCGLWVEQSAEALEKAILRLLGDPRAAREMGERGRELVTEKYLWPTIGRRMLEHYERACPR